MTRPACSLLIAAGDDLDGALASIGAAGLVRDPSASWEVILTTTTPTGLQHPWLHEHVVPDARRTVQLDAALAAAHGTWVAVLGPGDRIEPGALEAVHNRLASTPDLDVLYTDEQWPGEGADGIFTKPSWAPEYERGIDYLGRLCFMRRSLLTAAGGVVAESAGAEEWDAHLRVVEHTDRVAHLPLVGVSRPTPPSVADDVWDAGVRAVARHFARAGQDVRTQRSEYPGGVTVWRAAPAQPLVSIVVPTGGAHRTVRGDDVLLVDLCARSLVERTDYDRWELVLVPSEGTDQGVVERVRQIVGDRLVVAPVDGPFNFSRSVNVGAAAASGELLLLLNDDIESIDADWLTRMVSVLQDPSIGAVGARLVHEDGRLQHVGVVYSDQWLPWHVLQGNPDGFTHFGLGLLDTDFVAATGACLLLARDVFHELGGLPEDLPLNYNDVDLCHKVIRSGRRVVVTPGARLHHYESSTRTAEILDSEVQRLQQRWSWLAWADPWENTRSLH